MSVVYMGAFPPGYGGVTIKNQNLYIALEKEMPIKKVDFNKVKRKNVKETIRLVFHLLNPGDRFVVGVSGKTTRKRFTQVLYYLNRKAMKKSIIMIMGGTASHDMSVDLEYKKCAKGYKKIYVETQSMKSEMEEAGFENVDIYPNGRFRPQKTVELKTADKKLRCVFFSQVQPEKGVDFVLKAAEALPNVDFTFYGKIIDEFKECFLNNVERLPNVSYCGVFKGTSEEVYAELSQYDVLLLPTRWEAEGVPGILVEGKIAGLAEIVTDHNYNAELDDNGQDGIVLKNNTVEELIEAILYVQENPDVLKKMKLNSRKSAEKYYIENSIPAIEANMCVGGGKIEATVLRCVFFSQIQPEKGADLVLEAARMLPNVDFSFYGNIVDDYKEIFMNRVNAQQNVSYYGVFKGSIDAVYGELSKYDVLLFPTKWDIEGVPGILVEGKIAGLAEIVSNKSYNAELVRNGTEGIVLGENSAADLAAAIQQLDENRKALSTLKAGSRFSAEQYFIENYISAIKRELEK